jgi:hypothetical protein
VPLGPVARLVQIELLVGICSWLAYAATTTGPDFAYDLRAASILFTLASSGVCIWLIQLRMRAARQTVVVTMLVSAALSVAEIIQTAWARGVGTGPTAVAVALAVAIPLATAAYFCLSGRMRSALSGSLAETDADRAAHLRAARAADSHGSGRAARPWRTWAWWRNLLICYCAFTLLGHWAEMAFCQLIRLGVVAGSYDPTNHMLWDEWLYPFPAEGIAYVLIVLLLHPLKERLLDRCGGHAAPALVMSTMANAVVCTGIDLITGLTCNADYHLWDYSDLPFNFMGQICLQNSVAYTLAATFIVWVLYPALDRLMHRPSEAMMNAVFAGLLPLYAFLELLYFVYLGPAGLVLG